MAEIRSVKLIDSTYSPAEASEVLLTLLNHKIMFLNAQIFNAREESGADTAHMEKRLSELKAAKRDIIKLTEQESEGRCLFEINCLVEIKTKEAIVAA